MATKTCFFCTEKFPKSEGVFTSCCSKRIHKECTSSLEKCPYCRQEPMILNYLGGDTKDVTTFIDRLLYIIQYLVDDINDAVHKCKCRGVCQHEKCKCLLHNPKQQVEELEKLNDKLNAHKTTLINFPMSMNKIMYDVSYKLIDKGDYRLIISESFSPCHTLDKTKIILKNLYRITAKTKFKETIESI